MKQALTIFFWIKPENNIRNKQVKKKGKVQLIMRSDLEGVRIWGGGAPYRNKTKIVHSNECSTYKLVPVVN